MSKEKQKNGTHEKVMSFLAAMRSSFPDCTIIFTHGACYGLFQILREIFPDARAYMTKSQEHIVTRIGGKYYEIRGEFINLEGKSPELTELNKLQHEYWETCVCSQRVEHMLKKYNATSVSA